MIGINIFVTAHFPCRKQFGDVGGGPAVASSGVEANVGPGLFTGVTIAAEGQRMEQSWYPPSMVPMISNQLLFCFVV